MTPSKSIHRVVKSFFFALAFALTFAGLFFFFLLTSIFMVGGDGSSYWFSNLAEAIMSFTLGTFGFDRGSGLSIIIWSWSIVVFEILFLYALFRFRNQTHTIDSNEKTWVYVATATLFFIVNLVIVFQIRGQNRADHDKKDALEKRLIEFVENHPNYVNDTGNNEKNWSIYYSEAHSKIPYYVLTVYGNTTRYAYVEVQEANSASPFHLRCFKTGRAKDPFKHPCEQD